MQACCDDFRQIMNDGVVVWSERGALADGRIMNDIFSDYYLRLHDERSGMQYYALNFCPFCGRALSARDQSTPHEP